MAKKPTRTLAQARKGIQPSEDYSPPLGFADDDLEDYSPTLDDEEDDDIPQIINPPKAKTPEEYREYKKKKANKQEQRSLRAKKAARTRRLNRGLRDKVRVTSIAMNPDHYSIIHSLGRGISPVMREAAAEYLERRGLLPASPKTVDQIKEQVTREVTEELRKEITEELKKELKGLLSPKRRSKNA